MVEHKSQKTINYTPGYFCEQCGAKAEKQIFCCNQPMKRVCVPQKGKKASY